MTVIPVGRGYGGTVSFSTDTGTTWTKIGNVQKFTFPDQSPTAVDVTHLESPNDTEESIPGMKTAVDLAIAMYYVEGSVWDIALKAIAPGTVFLLELVPGASHAARKFTCYLTSYRPTDVDPKNALMAEAKFRLMGEVTV